MRLSEPFGVAGGEATLATESQLSTVSIRADFIRPGGRFVRRGADRFELFPRASGRFAWGPLVGCLTFASLAVVDDRYESGVTFLVGLFVAVATVFGVWTVAAFVARRRPVARFDRRAGRFTYWAPSDTLLFPLNSVVAVQTLRYGPHVGAAAGASFRNRDSWEVNVVVGGSQAKRLCVACGGADESSPGRALAEFLETPLYSHLAQGGSVHMRPDDADSQEPAPLSAATLSSLTSPGSRPAPPSLRLIS